MAQVSSQEGGYTEQDTGCRCDGFLEWEFGTVGGLEARFGHCGFVTVGSRGLLEQPLILARHATDCLGDERRDVKLDRWPAAMSRPRHAQ